MTFKEREEKLDREIIRISNLLKKAPSQDPVQLRDQMSVLVANFGYVHELYRESQLEGHQLQTKILKDFTAVIPQWLSTAQSILKSIENERRVSPIT